ncbi:putative adenine-specific DNA-methyltransferase [Fibrella aestuarina BUZ 2]|uniref:Methyltransferase n=1 Tax=Fibrella aestuarina BUZ 2 TaxID=1166018 RepID=I0K6R7_9BACT|nr:site-specific DNA-methyltransferase [Fibrella aestuarina]CCG99820.1 putative adenine-specific DNA-methyltransferase [Fibrella aestuarina BUZ 2]
MKRNHIYQTDCLTGLTQFPDNSVDCCVTSPPYYGLRDYGCTGQIGLEETPDEYINRLVAVFREVRRVLKPEGTLWVNIGDSYANDGKWGGHTGGKHASVLHASPIGRNKRYTGLKPKDLIGIPWMLAFALRADGWYLRQDIIWHKPNPMPESVTDRCTKSHEYVFLLSKSERYYYDHQAIKEPVTASTIARLSQNIEEQKGSDRVPGKTNGPMKAVGGRAAGNKTHKYVSAYNESESEEYRTKAGLLNVADVAYETRNKRSVWTVSTKPFAEAHFATFPPDLIVPCIKAGCPAGGVVLDPFMGAGTTAIVARNLQRHYVGLELNPEYVELARRRIERELGPLDVLFARLA